MRVLFALLLMALVGFDCWVAWRGTGGACGVACSSVGLDGAAFGWEAVGFAIEIDLVFGNCGMGARSAK